MITPAPLILRGERPHMLAWPLLVMAFTLSGVSGALKTILEALQ